MDPENNTEGQDTDVEMVDIHESTREDRKAYMDNVHANEQFNDDGSPAEEAEAPVEVQPAPIAPKPAVPATVTPQAKPAQPNTPTPQTPEEIQSLVEERTQLLEKNKQKELFIQRRNTELGELKKNFRNKEKELEDTKQRLQASLEEKLQLSPVEGLRDAKRIEQLDSEIAAEQSREANLDRIYEAEQAFLAVHDPNVVTLDSMVSVLKELDKVDDRFITSFRQNPYNFIDAGGLVQLGFRAKDFQDTKIIARHAVNLEKENQRLKAENDQLRTGKKTFAQNVQRNLNAAPPITASNPNLPNANSVLVKPPHEMTRAERAEFQRLNP